MADIQKLRDEYGLRSYSGVRIGCLHGYTGFAGTCSRMRHFFKNEIEGEIHTVASIKSRLTKEEQWRQTLSVMS